MNLHFTSIRRWLAALAARRRRLPPGSVRRSLALVVLAAVAPLAILQVAIYATWVDSRRDNELQANLEVANAIGVAFDGYVRDVSRQCVLLQTTLAELKADPETAGRLLRRNAAQYQSVVAWHWIGDDGRTLASTEPGAAGKATAVGQRLRAQGDSAVGDLYLVDGVPRFCVFPSSPRAAHTIVAEVDSSRLGLLGLPDGRIREGRLTLFDRSGRLAYGNPPAAVALGASYVEYDPLLAGVLSTGERQIGRIATPPDYVERFAARTPCAFSGWVVGASRPIATAMATVRKTLWLIAALNLGVLAVSAVLVARVASMLLRSLDTLQTHVEALGRGELGHRIEVGGFDELAHLADRFNVMAQRLADRTDAVEQALDNLRRSNQELEQFAYVASHDLQEPLRVIIGYLQLIEQRYRDKLDKDGNEFIDFAVDAAARQKQLIGDLLEYSRVHRRGQPLAPTRIEAALVRARSMLAVQIAESHPQITHDPLPTVMGDEGQLAQLLQNLLGNAMKFCREEPPQIHIACRREGDWWTFAVSDNGIGIEKEYWEQVFAIFQRLHTRKKYAGTGIGLAICRRIVERHGGRMWLESQPNVGSTFYFTLRAAEDRE